MPRNRKIFIHNKAVFITSRIEEGLPLVPNELINTILWSILARARSLYSVRVCHFLFMSNHLHMLAVIDDPEHLPRFMRYIKSESAHAINRLLGRNQRTVWSEGYDSPVILNIEDVFRYIEYLYTNPQRANLVESIDEYPGVSSWTIFKLGYNKIEAPVIKRETIMSLDKKTRLTKSAAKSVLNEILDNNSGVSEFVLEPFAFLDCFPKRMSKYDVKRRILEDVEREELRIKEKRQGEVWGVSKLIHEDIEKPHTPKSGGKRMICLSSDKEERESYIDWFKEVSKSASKAYQVLLLTGACFLFPAGVFLPGGFILSNINPASLLC